MADDSDQGDDATGGSNFEADEAKFREAFLRGESMDDDADEGDKKVAKPKKDAKVEAAADASDDGESDDEDDVDLDDDDDVDHEDEEDDRDDDEQAASEKDPDVAKRLTQVRRYEQRARERARQQDEARNRDFEQKQQAFVAEWKPRVEAAEAFERAKASGDIVAVAQSMGYDEDSFEELSQIFHGYSKAGATDPKWKAFAKRLQKDHATKRELAETKAGLARIEQERAAERTEREELEKRDRYLGRVEKSATDAMPMLKKDLARSPAGTREKLRKLAFRMAEKLGAVPDPKKVAARYEKIRRTGVERDAELYDIVKPAGSQKAKTGSIRVEDRSGGRSSGAKSNDTNGAAFLSDEDMIRNLREGNLD